MTGIPKVGHLYIKVRKNIHNHTEKQHTYAHQSPEENSTNPQYKNIEGREHQTLPGKKI